MDMHSIGKFLLIAGVTMALLGGAFLIFDKIPFLGKLPGDIRIEKENFKLYIPLTTTILLSVFVSMVLWLISYFRK